LSDDIFRLTVQQLITAVASGDLTAVQVVEHFLGRIDSRDQTLNAFITVNREQALADAHSIDEKRKNNQPLGVLAGLPIGIKDGICTAGLRTTAASRMLADFIPPYDATVIERLKRADAVIIGKTNLDEFSMGSTTETSCFGPTRNPWSLTRSPGGSSGGSAAAVAAGMVPLALGSDTGGSVRQPAAFCNLTGLKPSYGQVSRWGLIAYASSLDQIGPLARTAEDCARLMGVIAGHDPRDSTSARHPASDYLRELNQPLQGLRIGVCREHLDEGLDPEIRDAIEVAQQHLLELGARQIEVSLKLSPLAVPTYYVVAPCEASSNLARYDGVRYTFRQSQDDLDAMYCQTRGTGFGAEVQRRIMLGTYALSSGYYEAYYLRASKLRGLIREEYQRVLQQCDVILGPTCPTPPLPLGQAAIDPLALYLADIYTVSANLAGIPALSLPCGFNRQGLPIGLQLQGKMFTDSKLLAIAHQFQQLTDWHLKHPTLPEL
jgi:aspartyl-tRNA(Asn)/glutamyl-tRNA(Gln) amidotransferase subunit A